ncbi:MAG: hypothetical protein A2Y17_05535 [Clostridiales bacterium GWF2_38_85]|nr:MAG: hypothetical protein A2Y17_05535 [Clostridiales bacterium GWF2_38_85]HBL83312.1 hypothetical protein [Clostridiales bacterium]
MLRVFRKLMIAYYTVCFVCVVVVTGVMTWIVQGLEPYYILFIDFISAMICIFVIALIFNIIALKKYYKIGKIRLEECNLDKFIFENEKLLNKNRNRSIRNFLLINIAGAYLEKQDLQRAKEVLDSIIDFKNTNFDKNNKISYVSNLTSYLIRIKQFDEARKTLDRMQYYIKALKAVAEKNSANEAYFSLQQLLKMEEKNNYEGAEEFYLDKLKKSIFMLEKVKWQFVLSKIYLRENRTDETKHFLCFAAEHGGTTYYAQEAKIYLGKLKETEQNFGDIINQL